MFGAGLIAGNFGDAKIDELDATACLRFVEDDDVGRLDVAVDDIFRVGIVEAAADFGKNRQNFFDRQWSSFTDELEQ